MINTLVVLTLIITLAVGASIGALVGEAFIGFMATMVGIIGGSVFLDIIASIKE